MEATSGSETRSRSRRVAAPATGISTRSFDSELQDALLNRRRSIAQVLKDKNKVTKEQFGSTVMEQSAMIVKKMQKRLGGVNVYLQYVTGKGFVSPVYKTTSLCRWNFCF